MISDSRSTELGEVLEQLKTRSGRSYDKIGRQVHLSKSAVHRYCTGASIPRQFGVLERIALACGASREEMASLHRVWLRATALESGVVQATGRGPEEPAPIVPEETRLPVDHHALPGRRRAKVLMAVVLVLVLVTMSAGAGGRATSSGAPPQPQWVPGPAWTLPPAAVPSTLFGVTINSGTGAMPTFRTGAVRFWDGGTRWSEIQRRRGEFDWSALDRLVNGAERAGVPALFVFGSTPKWASPSGAAGPYPDGTPAPPVELGDWDAYVRAVAERYRGRIEAYELWVLANDNRFYAGSVETLVEMTRRAAGAIRAVDPAATLVCPGMGQLWNSEGVDFLRRFAESGGYDHCDVAGIKLFQQKADDPPETMLNLTTAVDRVLHEIGIHPKLWSTGTTYSIVLQQPLDERTARNHAVRFYLAGIYARKVNLERMYFYNWGGTRIPIVLQAVGGMPTDAALAVEQLQRWLRDAQSRACGHGGHLHFPDNVWQCEFTVTGPDRTYDATIRWTATGTATVTAGPRDEAIHHLDHRVTTVRPGDAVTITEEPVLIVSRPSK